MNVYYMHYISGISALFMVTEQQTPNILLQCSGTQLSTCESSFTTSKPCPGINVTCQGVKMPIMHTLTCMYMQQSQVENEHYSTDVG